MKALVLLALVGLPAAAEGLSGADTAALVAAAMARAGVAGAPPAPLRPLPPCSHVPHVGPSNGSWTTAELRCDAPDWKRVLRTRSPARHAPRIAGDPAPDRPAAVLARPVARGAALAPEDLAPEDPAAEGLATGVPLPAPLARAYVGRRLRVALPAGQAILPRHLEPDWLVTRGDPVALRMAAGAIEVLAPGEALSDGAFGDLVEVRNLSSGVTVRATVTARNMAEVRPNMR